jgi:gamma-glutamyltranspeptidase
MGHSDSGATSTVGGYQGIWRTNNPLTWFGGSDPRKDGAALGF